MKEKTNPKLNQVLIGIGSNLNPDLNIAKAISLLKSQVTIRNISSIYQSTAVGSSGPDYLNSAVLIETGSSLEMLRKNILSPIENQLKRIRSENKYMDRTIDLDIIIFNQTINDHELWTQAHIAVPASDILPEFINPKTGENISQAAIRLMSENNIKLRSDLSR